VVIDALMKRGMLIDIDHMSTRTVRDVFAFTSNVQYPLVAGHNGVRDTHAVDSTERQLSVSDIKELASRKGMVGVGFAEATADKLVMMINKLVVETGVSVAIGSDANGLSPLAAPRPGCATSPCVVYSTAFPRAQLGTKTWDYNSVGMAHYGLLPDFLRDAAGQPSGVDAAFYLLNGPEAFAAMWERAEAVGADLRE
jgi:microsomal dipeptidase-like Zn-dependent dipeptidase